MKKARTDNELIFERLCLLVAERVDDIQVTFYTEDKSASEEFEDDGALHVQRGRLRAVFDVSLGQTSEPSVQNGRTREVMELLGISVSNSVLVNETNYCEFCGQVLK